MPPPSEHAATGAELGARLRALRLEKGMSMRRLAADLGISPSAVSQIERGVMQPSVSRLIAITDVLEVPLSAVFDPQNEPGPGGAGHTAPREGAFSLARDGQIGDVELSGGVIFRRLSPTRMPGIDFFESTYPPRAEAAADSEHFRHEGYEIGHVLSGQLTIEFDDEVVVMHPGDSISYACSTSHRIRNASYDTAATATWLIVHG